MKIQLSIQGGGAKIVCLLAAMEALEELVTAKKIEVTRIAGTSAGAIVGAVFASGYGIRTFKEKLQAGLGATLSQSFSPPNFWAYYKLLKDGKAFWNEETLKEHLDKIFGSVGVKYVGDLAEKTGTELIIVKTHLTEASSRRSSPGDFLSNALLESAGLPFCFRTWSGPNANVVDGGICENFPWEELVAEDTEKYGPIFGISFERTRPAPPRNVRSFAMALLDTAIDNGMEKSRQRLGRKSIFSIETDITTADFPKALAALDGDSYKLIRRESGNFFAALLGAPKHKIELKEEDFRQQSLAIMEKIGEMYRVQHKRPNLFYEHCVVVVEAKSLDGQGQIDEVHYSCTFRAVGEPVYCLSVILSESADPMRIDRTVFDVVDDQGNVINTIAIPLVDAGAPSRKEVLLFFNPVLQPGSVSYTFNFTDEVEDVLKPLREKNRDDISFLPARSAGNNVSQIDLVLHYPAKLAIEMRAQKDDSFGKEMDPWHRKKNYPSPAGFKTIGWTGKNVNSTKKFGVDLLWAS